MNLKDVVPKLKGIYLVDYGCSATKHLWNGLVFFHVTADDATSALELADKERKRLGWAPCGESATSIYVGPTDSDKDEVDAPFWMS